jgi:hypothetical protein
MGLPRRDALHHTYADYCNWPEEVRYELLDGTAYLMSPAPSRQHQAIYRLENALFARPSIHELRGHTSVAAVPDLIIDWDAVQAHIGPV